MYDVAQSFNFTDHGKRNLPLGKKETNETLYKDDKRSTKSADDLGSGGVASAQRGACPSEEAFLLRATRAVAEHLPLQPIYGASVQTSIHHSLPTCP